MDSLCLYKKKKKSKCEKYIVNWMSMCIGFFEVNCNSWMLVVSSALSEAEDHIKKIKKGGSWSVNLVSSPLWSRIASSFYSLQEICQNFVFWKLSNQVPCEYPLATKL